jgi:hypothetical protein
MTTWTPDSIPEIASHCPACTPDLDPETYVPAWYRAHRPDLGGSGDEIAARSRTHETHGHGPRPCPGACCGETNWF